MAASVAAGYEGSLHLVMARRSRSNHVSNRSANSRLCRLRTLAQWRHATGERRPVIGHLLLNSVRIQADIVIGYVDSSGNVVFHDRWSEANAQPMIDDEQGECCKIK